MNKVILCGRAVRDAEIRYIQGSNMAVANYTLAVDRAFKKDGEPTADFILCVAFGKNAEFAEKFIYKGTKMIVEGRWQTGSYTNKDGNKVYTNDCIVERHEFCESKNSSSNSDNGNNLRPVPVDDNVFMSIPDGIEDQLPFA